MWYFKVMIGKSLEMNNGGYGKKESKHWSDVMTYYNNSFYGKNVSDC